MVAPAKLKRLGNDPGFYLLAELSFPDVTVVTGGGDLKRSGCIYGFGRFGKAPRSGHARDELADLLETVPH